MNGRIPKDHTWCSLCINPDNYYREDESTTCADHTGPDGEPAPYEGYDVYEPSDWVLSAVGARFRAYDVHERCLRAWICTGYDPRHGFWMKALDEIDGLSPRLTNVSERAIGQSFRKNEIRAGGEILIHLTSRLGRLPVLSELNMQQEHYDRAKRDLLFAGYLTSEDEMLPVAKEHEFWYYPEYPEFIHA